MSEERLRFPTRSEQLARYHSIEWAEGWQYARTHRIVRGLTEATRDAAVAEPPAELMVPPEGDGWELNTDRAVNGYEAKAPSWSADGTALQQLVYWRRRKAGIPSWDPKARLSVARDDVSL